MAVRNPAENITGEEETLIADIRSGSDKAFEQLFFRFYKPLCLFACRYSGSMSIAEELVQDAFQHLWEFRKNLDPGGNLRTLLYQSVKNRALDHLKHQKVMDKYEYEIENRFYDQIHEPGRHAISFEDFEETVRQCIEDLSKSTRNVYKLHRMDGLTYLEIAEILDISVKTVEFHMSKALSILRDRLSKFVPALLLSLIREFVA